MVDIYFLLPNALKCCNLQADSFQFRVKQNILKDRLSMLVSLHYKIRNENL